VSACCVALLWSAGDISTQRMQPHTCSFRLVRAHTHTHTHTRTHAPVVRLSLVPQDPVVFGGTFRSNLDPFDQLCTAAAAAATASAGGGGGGGDAAIWAALRQSGLDGLVRSMGVRVAGCECVSVRSSCLRGGWRVLCVCPAHRARLRAQRQLIPPACAPPCVCLTRRVPHCMRTTRRAWMRPFRRGVSTSAAASASCCAWCVPPVVVLCHSLIRRLAAGPTPARLTHR
jgi:hypothetical protein